MLELKISPHPNGEKMLHFINSSLFVLIKEIKETLLKTLLRPSHLTFFGKKFPRVEPAVSRSLPLISCTSLPRKNRIFKIHQPHNIQIL